MHKLISLWKNNQQIIRYLIFGVLTTLVSLVIYGACVYTVLDPQDPIQLAAANVLSWIGAVTFAYFTNAKWVFEAQPESRGEWLRQFVSFYAGRLATLGVEELLLFVLVTLLHCNDMLIKVIGQVVVVVLNYVISKLLIFRKKKEDA